MRRLTEYRVDPLWAPSVLLCFPSCHAQANAAIFGCQSESFQSPDVPQSLGFASVLFPPLPLTLYPLLSPLFPPFQVPLCTGHNTHFNHSPNCNRAEDQTVFIVNRFSALEDCFHFRILSSSSPVDKAGCTSLLLCCQAQMFDTSNFQVCKQVIVDLDGIQSTSERHRSTSQP